MFACVLLFPVLDSLVFFSCPHELVSPVPSYTRTLLLTDQPKLRPVFAPTGERLSPYVALACIAMAVRMILS